ncbi:MAG TPA: hypothetical protein VFD70_16090 [Anaerolineae bacterium]|nr:hypothetical protein [Anaerolineae bacterium]
MQPKSVFVRQANEPSLSEMQAILEHAERCLHCRATPCDSGSPCYEFTPGGVESCSALVWWNGQPILPETLRRWKEIVISYQTVPHRPDD